MRRFVPWSKVFRYLLALVCVVTLNFFLVHLMPGDPLVHLLGEEAYGFLQAQKPEQLASLKAAYGLDGPLVLQYLTYVTKTLKGDLGWSFHYNQPVLHVILFRLKWTLLLLAPSLGLSVIVGAILGALSGFTHRFNRLDRLLTPVVMVLHAVPVYCLAFLCLLVFAFYAGIAPLGGMTGSPGGPGSGIWGVLRHMLLPTVVVTTHATALYYVIMRSAVTQVCGEAFVFNGAARGFSPMYLLFRHVLKNALLPFVTLVAMQSGVLFGGALLVEVVFSWQGVGSLIYDAIALRDYPLLSGCFLMISICVLFANALADVIYGLIDPRVRDGAPTP